MEERKIRKFETSDLEIEVIEFPDDSDEAQLNVTLRHNGTEDVSIFGGVDKHDELTIVINEEFHDSVILRADITFLDLLEEGIKRYRKYNKKAVK